MSLYCNDMVKPYYTNCIQKQPFADVLQIGVLENFGVI